MRSGATPGPNLDALEALAHEAAAQGAVYALSPEVTVAYAADREQLERVAWPWQNNPAIARCGQIARDTGLTLHLGSLAVALDDGRFANRSVVFSPEGAITATYDKIHLFDATLPGQRDYRESATYAGGDRAVVTEAAGLKLGLTICYDVRFPALHRALAMAGAEVLAAPAAFTVPTGEAHWEVLLRARAIETGSFVIAAAQAGQHPADDHCGFAREHEPEHEGSLGKCQEADHHIGQRAVDVQQATGNTRGGRCSRCCGHE